MDMLSNRVDESGFALLPGIEQRVVTRIDGAGRRVETNLIAIEEPLQVVLDGKPVAVLMRSPGNEKELAVGFCLSEGLIASFAEIALVQHCGRSTIDPMSTADELDLSRNVVQITRLRRPASEQDGRYDVLRLIRSGCGRADPAELAAVIPPVTSALRVPVAVLKGLARRIVEGQESYKQAGGVHGVALFDAEGRRVAVGEDVGRHNALDKTLGYCILRGIPLDDKIAYTTGRASSEMVMKSARVGLPILISRSSPTTLAIDLAEQVNLTLIGYARGDRLTIYAHPERIMD